MRYEARTYPIPIPNIVVGENFMNLSDFWTLGTHFINLSHEEESRHKFNSTLNAIPYTFTHKSITNSPTFVVTE